VCSSEGENSFVVAGFVSSGHAHRNGFTKMRVLKIIAMRCAVWLWALQCIWIIRDIGDPGRRAVTSSTPPAFRLRLVSKTSDGRSSSNWKQGEQSRAKQDNAEDGYRQESRGGKFVAHGTPLPCRPD